MRVQVHTIKQAYFPDGYNQNWDQRFRDFQFLNRRSAMSGAYVLSFRTHNYVLKNFIVWGNGLYQDWDRAIWSWRLTNEKWFN